MWGYLLGFFASIVPILGSLISGMAVQGLVSVGVGVLTFTGMQSLFDYAMDAMINYFSGLPSDLIQLLGLMGVDLALNIVFSAGVTLLTIKGMSKAGSFSRQVWRKE